MSSLTSLRALSSLTTTRSLARSGLLAKTTFRPTPIRTRIPRASLATSHSLLVNVPVFGKDFEKEREAHRHAKIRPDPEHVTSTSSETPMRDFGRSPLGAPPEPNMEAALENDLVSVRNHQIREGWG